jgi:hypothetical protein
VASVAASPNEKQRLGPIDGVADCGVGGLGERDVRLLARERVL